MIQINFTDKTKTKHMKHIAFTIPFWNVGNEKERLENIGYVKRSCDNFADYFNKNNKNDFKIDVILANLGEEINPLYPEARFYQHTGLKYRFEKPTRMNTLFLDLLEEGYDFVGMCDPDIILFEEYFEKLTKNIEDNLDYFSMLTYSVARTKPELRKDLILETREFQHLSNHELIIESNAQAENWRVCGGAYFMSLEFFRDLGGWNEDYRVYGMDDDDYTFRFELTGGSVVTDTSIIWHHLWHPTVLGTAPDYELERYEYECMYRRLSKDVYEEQIKSHLCDRTNRLEHLSDRFNKAYSYPDSFIKAAKTNNVFSYEIGKRSIETMPIEIKRKLGLVNDDKFYGSC
ncbi:gp171 [Sphingomonas phage PAU]|uniref:gp171 n=1 Tax=Sphingomonas phage PAU TaxID=1150991 RepID=UPI00025732F7|nr:gp171 [Sphingomonas phage PAU]AFF28169.1 gp171 [Sphingomonas phage PAU]